LDLVAAMNDEPAGQGFVQVGIEGQTEERNHTPVLSSNNFWPGGSQMPEMPHLTGATQFCDLSTRFLIIL